MNITTEITSSEIHSSELKRSNSASDYFFITADIVCTISYDDRTTVFLLQTGSYYINNDYSLPTNSLSIYDESCNDVLIELLERETTRELEKQNTIDSINEDCETSYSMTDMIEIKTALNDLVIEAKQIIQEAEDHAEAELEADSTIYVLKEYIETEEETGQRIPYDYPSIEKFSSHNDAEKYVDETKNTRIISKEDAISDYTEFL